MIKGINKQVLEILETNNGYFEKALFFVKPEYSGYSENKLRELAQLELKTALLPPNQKQTLKTNRFKLGILGLSLFLFGVFSGFLFSFVIWYLFHDVIK